MQKSVCHPCVYYCQKFTTNHIYIQVYIYIYIYVYEIMLFRALYYLYFQNKFYIDLYERFSIMAFVHCVLPACLLAFALITLFLPAPPLCLQHTPIIKYPVLRTMTPATQTPVMRLFRTEQPLVSSPWRFPLACLIFITCIA